MPTRAPDPNVFHAFLDALIDIKGVMLAEHGYPTSTTRCTRDLATRERKRGGLCAWRQQILSFTLRIRTAISVIVHLDDPYGASGFAA
jgi:hypothetical protein